jgi:hypothetical protein
MSKRSLAERVVPRISTPLTCAVKALRAGPAGDRDQNLAPPPVHRGG